jgi:4,5-dihydroxyphthalate decarboxylase
MLQRREVLGRLSASLGKIFHESRRMSFDDIGTIAAKSASRLDLSLALSDNQNNRPLLDGSVSMQGARLIPTAVHPSEMFWRQLKYGDFDISEMSLSSLMISISQGLQQWIAIPVFTSREFYHTRALVRAGANIQKPADLRGKRVGVPEYQQTAAIWGRAALAHEFGVQPREIEWFMERPVDKSHGGATAFKAPPGVTVNQIPATTDIGEMLIDGKLDATLLYLANRNLVDRSRAALTSDPRIRPLFPDRKAEGRRYYAKAGLYPINHTIVVRRSLLDSHPWIALNLYHAFAAARAEVMSRGREFLRSYDELGMVGEAGEAVLVDSMPYGLAANRAVLETLSQYIFEQGLTTRQVDLGEVFAKSTLDL